MARRYDAIKIHARIRKRIIKINGGLLLENEADKYAKQLRTSSPLLVTTVKPEGTLSQVAGGVSSGLHHSHSPFYIRRIRINSVDPLAKVALDLGWNVNPEVGTTR
jgi:ribonucleoside-triphosphate reductase